MTPRRYSCMKSLNKFGITCNVINNKHTINIIVNRFFHFCSDFYYFLYSYNQPFPHNFRISWHLTLSFLVISRTFISADPLLLPLRVVYQNREMSDKIDIK